MRAEGVDTVFITGFTTSGCVRASGVDCVSSNFRTVVFKEACGDRDPPAHEANLYDLGAKYAEMVSLDEALNCWNQSPSRRNAAPFPPRAANDGSNRLNGRNRVTAASDPGRRSGSR